MDQLPNVEALIEAGNWEEARVAILELAKLDPEPEERGKLVFTKFLVYLRLSNVIKSADLAENEELIQAIQQLEQRLSTQESVQALTALRNKLHEL